MKKSLLRQCLCHAQNHIKKHPRRTYFHYSFIVQNNKIIEWGINKTSNPPIHYGYNKNHDDGSGNLSIHAEISAWKKAKDLLCDAPWECINIRLTRCGDVRMSKPCPCCQAFLRAQGCAKFYFTTGAGWAKMII